MLAGTSLGRWDLVEEAKHGVDATVVVEDDHVEADDERFGIGRAESPGEAGLLMVRVDRPTGLNVNPGNCWWTAPIVASMASRPVTSASGSV